jgi:hypothetical protein
MRMFSACFLLILFASASAHDFPLSDVEFTRLLIEWDSQQIPNGEEISLYSSETIQLAEGDLIKIIDWGGNGNITAWTEVAQSSEGPFIVLGIEEGSFLGPGLIRFYVRHNSGNRPAGFAFSTYAIVRSGSSVSAYSDQTGNLVIPENASGPVQVILEQSSDMLNWVSANPGTYDPAEGKRFFRLRAVINN